MSEYNMRADLFGVFTQGPGYAIHVTVAISSLEEDLHAGLPHLTC